MSLLFYGRPKNSPSSSFLIPNSKNGCTRQPSNIMYSFSRWPFFHFFFNTLLFISFLFLQLEIEVLKLFDATISDFSLVVRKVLDMISLSSYIHQWRLVVWEICFFWEFKPKDGIRRIKSWGQQLMNKMAIKRVLYNFIPFSSCFKLIYECLLVSILAFASPQSFPLSWC
jgi:hypothetical protein